MNMSLRVDSPTDDGRFPLVRKGYDRSVVDHFVSATQAQIAQLLQQYDALMSQQLRAPPGARRSQCPGHAGRLLRTRRASSGAASHCRGAGN